MVFGALIAVLVLLCTGQSAGAAVRQPAHSQHTVSQHAAGAAKPAAGKTAAARKAAEHRAAVRKAAEHRAALRKAAARKAAEQRDAYQASASRSSDVARPAAASRTVSQDAAKHHAARKTHATQQSQHQRKTAKHDSAEQNLADRKQAAADARDNRQAIQDGAGSVDSPAALPSRSQLAAKAAAEVAARLAAARKTAEQLVRQQAAARKPNQPVAAGPAAREVGIRSPGTGRSTRGQQPVVSLSPGAATHTSPAARPRPTHPAGSRSLPHRIITEPAEPIAALASVGLSVGSGPALLVLAVVAGVGLLLVAAGTRRTWLSSAQVGRHQRR